MRKTSFLLALLCLLHYGSVAQETGQVYVFSYFKDNGQDGLHLAYSRDGYHYQALRGDSSFLTPTAGKDKLMRDPCIIRGGDGRFHMVWTVSWNEKSIGYASSPDLVNWSEQQTIPVMEHEPGARNCWAPEIFYEPSSKQYMVYWATTVKGLYPETQDTTEKAYNHRMYYVTTRDFKTFTPAKLLYEPGFNVIDATIQKEGRQYVMFLKDETRTPPQKNIRLAFSDVLTGPYTKAGTPITGRYWAEGPTAIKVKGEWLVYFDKYTEHTYGAVTSKDLKTWKDVSDKVSFPAGARHGTVFTVSPSEWQKLRLRAR